MRIFTFTFLGLLIFGSSIFIVSKMRGQSDKSKVISQEDSSRDKPNRENIVSPEDFFNCVIQGKEEEAKQLLERCANLEEILTKRIPIVNYPALHYAAIRNRIKIVRAIVEKAPNLQAILEMQTNSLSILNDILTLRVEKEISTEIVEIIIKKVDNLDKLLLTKSGPWGFTPLHIAIYAKKDALLHLLLASSKNKKQFLTVEDDSKHRYTIIHAAFDEGSVEAAEIILEILKEEKMLHLIDKPNSIGVTPRNVVIRHAISSLLPEKIREVAI